MDAATQRTQFEQRYEPEVRSLLVLTRNTGPGQSRDSYTDPLWTAVQTYEAAMDEESGEVIATGGRIVWLLEEGEDPQERALTPQTVHRIRARTVSPAAADPDSLTEMPNDLALVDALEAGVEDPRFAPVVAELRRFPDEKLTTKQGTFTLQRDTLCYIGFVRLGLKKVRVYLELDTTRSVTEATLRTLDALVDAKGSTVRELAAYGAGELTTLANQWAQEAGSRSLSTEKFAKRITARYVSIAPDGAYAMGFDDDGIFDGHEVYVQVDAAGRPLSADMVG